MGKNTGFLEYQREESLALSPAERIGSFSEFHTPLDNDARQTQGARCMNCGVPFCQAGAQIGGSFSGCPLHNLIPEWNDELFHGHWEQALARLCKTNNFPEFTGRVCPALCESACTCGLNDSPVTVRENELSIIENGFAQGYVTPRVPAVRSGKSVAVIGSGPAGLAVADQLNRRSHSVTVFERDERPGGLMMYGIPGMKLDKEIIARRVRLMETEGVMFQTNADVGAGIPAADILGGYDAVALCCGARKPRPLEIGCENTQGVVYAVDYLSDVTRVLLGQPVETPLSAAGKHIVIVGGGDTGNDCVATVIRQGCRSVAQLVRKPRQPDARPADNPWPQPARTCKTDYGQQEAIAVFGHDPRLFQTSVKELVRDENGSLTAVRVVYSEPVRDKSGRVRMQELPDSETLLPCELLIVATGFSGCEDGAAEAFGASLTEKGVVATAANRYATAVPKLFAAGDAHRGASLVVWAIAEGRACANEIDRFLMGYSNMV